MHRHCKIKGYKFIVFRREARKCNVCKTTFEIKFSKNNIWNKKSYVMISFRETCNKFAFPSFDIFPSLSYPFKNTGFP